MYRNYCVTSDVQFRKGASIPPFGWADFRGKFSTPYFALMGMFDPKPI